MYSLELYDFYPWEENMYYWSCVIQGYSITPWNFDKGICIIDQREYVLW